MLPKSNGGLIFAHWTQGGTALTNIGPERMVLFLEAVIRFNDPAIVLSDRAIPPGDKVPRLCAGSLHCTDGRPDMSEFWECFRKVEAEEKV